MGITSNTKFYLKIALRLNLSVVIIITAIDLINKIQLESFINEVKQLIKSQKSKKLPILVNSMKDICLFGRNMEEGIMPIFTISTKTGYGLEYFTSFLRVLPPSSSQNNITISKDSLNERLIFDIHEHFMTLDKKIVVAGFVSRGKLALGQKYYLGPNKSGNYVIVEVEGLHCKKIPNKFAYKGQFITVCLKSKHYYII